MYQIEQSQFCLIDALHEDLQYNRIKENRNEKDSIRFCCPDSIDSVWIIISSIFFVHHNPAIFKTAELCSPEHL